MNKSTEFKILYDNYRPSKDEIESMALKLHEQSKQIPDAPSPDRVKFTKGEIEYIQFMHGICEKLLDTIIRMRK